MRTMMRAWMIAALLAALAIASGCEDTPLTAGKDFTLSLVATPSTVLIDPARGINSADSSIVARILNAAGVPQKNLTVYFSSINGGGVLASGGEGVTTDANGVAHDVLTVRKDDGAEVTVSASSSTLTQTVKVTKSIVPANRPPVATIVASPAGEQAVGRAVTFNGGTSSDPDAGDFITIYSWSVTSSAPDSGWVNPFVRTGPGATLSFPAGFTHAQNLSVLLTVTDSHSLTGVSAPMNYAIKAQLCTDNTKPTAVIAGGATLVGPVDSHKLFVADGTASSDLEGPIQTYQWSCGNGTTPVVTPVGGNGSMVTCDYVVASTSKTYNVTLIVTDQGFGAPSYTCAEQSSAATVQVVVSP